MPSKHTTASCVTNDMVQCDKKECAFCGWDAQVSEQGRKRLQEYGVQSLRGGVKNV